MNVLPNAMKYVGIMQEHIDRYKLQNYLEIGVKDGHSFFTINVPNRYGVEPEITFDLCVNSLAFDRYQQLKETNMQWKIYNKTSDEYFKNAEGMFDIIFVDGLHEYKQVYRDIENSLLHLTDDGFIFVHDTNPLDEKVANPTAPIVSDWSGDVWKAIVDIQTKRDDIEIATYGDVPFGLTVIRKTKVKQQLRDWDVSNMYYPDFAKDRKVYLNIQ
jgi:hypothetical protein